VRINARIGKISCICCDKDMGTGDLDADNLCKECEEVCTRCSYCGTIVDGEGFGITDTCWYCKAD
jgi:hypothetical protein